MYRNGSLKSRQPDFSLKNELMRMTVVLSDAKAGGIYFLVYDLEAVKKQIVQSLKKIPQLTFEEIKLSPSKLNAKTLRIITASIAETAVLISGFSEFDKANPKTCEFVKSFAATLLENKSEYSVLILIPINTLYDFFSELQPLWKSQKNFFWIENGDLDRHRKAHYWLDLFDETKFYPFVENKRWVLERYNQLQLCYSGETDYPYLHYHLLAKIAKMHFLLGEYKLALQILKKQKICLQSIRDEKLLPESLNNIGVVNAYLGRFEKSRQYFETGLKAAEKALRGAHHPGKIFLKSNLGKLFSFLHQPTQAFVTTREALRMGEQKLGMRSPKLIPLLINFAKSLCDRENYEDALDHLRRALHIGELRLDISHPYMAVILQQIGMVYYLQKKFDLSRRYIYRTVETLEKALGPTHPYFGEILNQTGLNHLATEQPKLALKYFQWALQIRHDTLGTDDYLRGFILLNISKALQKLGDKISATENLKQAGDILTRYLPKDHPQLLEIQSAIVNLEEEIQSLNKEVSPSKQGDS
jgi:tetratricopeptide (TPR) repeat protein